MPDAETPYVKARAAIELAHWRGAGFAELEALLKQANAGLEDDEREALWLYAWGLRVRRLVPT